MTPHISGSSLSAQARYAAGTREILESYFAGKPIRTEYLIVDKGKLAGTGAKSYTAGDATRGSEEAARAVRLGSRSDPYCFAKIEKSALYHLLPPPTSEAPNGCRLNIEDEHNRRKRTRIGRVDRKPNEARTGSGLVLCSQPFLLRS